MCWYFCRTIGQRMCCFFDKILTGTVFLGGISTATTTTLQYTGYIDEWKAVVISSVITFLAIMGCVLRYACKAQNQTSVNNQTIIINNTPQKEQERSSQEVAVPVKDIEITTQQLAHLTKSDVLQEVHKEWSESRNKS